MISKVATTLTTDLASSLQSFIDQLCHEQLVRQKTLTSSSHLSTARLAVLQFLIEKGPSSLKRLSEFRKVSPATMSKLVASLREAGLVLKANSKKDARSKIFFVSTEGRKQATQVTTDQLVILTSKLSQLTVTEQKSLKESITLIKNVINPSGIRR